jgi:kynureninase
VTATGLDGREREALDLDARDAVGLARERFVLPKDDSPSPYPELAYLVGNSLGPQPADAAHDVRRELEDWATLGVEGHWSARSAWSDYHVALRGPMARVVGAEEREVVVMNSLTVNLHLLLASFYRPTPERHRIVIEDAAFPSDSYAVRSHAAFRGYDPDEAVVRLAPREGERVLRTEDVVAHLEAHAASTALVLLGGVNFKTGQLMELAPITAVARGQGIPIGWDLAHGAGNVELALHDWGPDFAAWCTYKYLNGGPGSTGAAFVHARHLADRTLPRLAGWWGTDPAVRFEMRPSLDPVDSADAWAISNPSILSMAPLRAALQVFDEVTMAVVRARSVRLTAYFERLVREVVGVDRVAVVTPSDPSARGCQLSLAVRADPEAVVASLRRDHGVIGDARPPDVVRLAPAPLFCTYHDCWRAAVALRAVLS